jgi:AraC-like DNA-binding protein
MAGNANLSKIDVLSLKSKRSSLHENWHAERVNDNFSRIYYIKKGSGYIESFGRRHELKAGMLYLIPPRGNYAYGCHGHVEIWWVHFTATIVAGISLFDYLSFNSAIAPADRREVEKKIARIIDCGAESTLCSTIQCHGILLELISMFLHPAISASRNDYHRQVERFIPVLEHITGNLGGNIPVAALARIAGYERSHFTVLFKKIFGTPPAAYVNNQRVGAVLAKMHCGNFKLHELAAQFGFCDAYHLSKVVKKHTGKSPREHSREFAREAP